MIFQGTSQGGDRQPPPDPGGISRLHLDYGKFQGQRDQSAPLDLLPDLPPPTEQPSSCRTRLIFNSTTAGICRSWRVRQSRAFAMTLQTIFPGMKIDPPAEWYVRDLDLLDGASFYLLPMPALRYYQHHS